MAWSTTILDTFQWLQIILNEVKQVSGILTQGKTDAWITYYEIETSEDNDMWEYIAAADGTHKVHMCIARFIKGPYAQKS